MPPASSFLIPLQDKWVPDLRLRLEKFLTLSLQSTPQPRLFELYVSLNEYTREWMNEQIYGSGHETAVVLLPGFAIN